MWEGAHAAARYALDNVVAIVDHNKLQQFGWHGDTVAERLPVRTPGPNWSTAGRRSVGRSSRWTATTWPTSWRPLAAAKAHTAGRWPIIAHTIKGKGVSFMEGNYKWHARVPNAEEFALAMGELGEPGYAEGGAA